MYRVLCKRNESNMYRIKQAQYVDSRVTEPVHTNHLLTSTIIITSILSKNSHLCRMQPKHKITNLVLGPTQAQYQANLSDLSEAQWRPKRRQLELIRSSPNRRQGNFSFVSVPELSRTFICLRYSE